MSILDIIILAAMIVLFVANTAVSILRQKGNEKMTLEDAQEIALSVISRVAMALVTDAERAYGSGTGELKMSVCLANLINILPENVVEIVPKSFLQENLEKALEIAKTKWLANPKLLNKDR